MRKWKMDVVWNSPGPVYNLHKLAQNKYMNSPSTVVWFSYILIVIPISQWKMHIFLECYILNILIINNT